MFTGGVFLLGFARQSNCGGNSAALGDCKNFVYEIRLQTKRQKTVFSCIEADEETRNRLRLLGRDHWLGSAHLLAKMNGLGIDLQGPRSVIMVCDTPFDNVPRCWFGRAPLSHAVAYSTGEIGLISPAEFRILDLSRFADLAKLEPGSKIRNDSAAGIGGMR
jgi:hypothetical protein